MRVLSVRRGFHDARHVLIRHRTCVSQLVVGGYAGGRIISIVSFAEVTPAPVELSDGTSVQGSVTVRSGSST